jgi:hypothetical protein
MLMNINESAVLFRKVISVNILRKKLDEKIIYNIRKMACTIALWSVNSLCYEENMNF